MRAALPADALPRIERVLDHVPAWKAPPVTQTVKVKAPAHGSRKWYRVRTGDTLVSIAKRFHLSVSALKERNNLSSGQVRAGELLSIH